MNYTKKELQQALSAVAPLTGKTGIMSCVKFGGNKITAMDSDILITYQISNDENYCCSGKDLLNTIKNFPYGDISLEITDKTVKIKSDKLKGKYKLPILPADDFPAFDAPDGDSITIPGMNDMIKSISYAASVDTIKPVFNGIHYDGKHFVATDSRRLSVIKTGSSSTIQFDSIIMPLRFANEMKRLFSDDISLIVSGNMITAHDDTITLTSRLVDGKFPNWQQVIPAKSTHTIDIDVAQLKSTISRIVGYANGPAFRLLFELTGNDMKISASNDGGGNAEETVTFGGDACEIRFALNGAYLLETLANVSGDVVQCGLTEPMSPVVFSCGDEKHVIMPIQIKEVEK